MAGRPRASASGPLHPAEPLPEDPEQLALLGDAGPPPAAPEENASVDAWRPPLAVPYVEAGALVAPTTADAEASDPDLPYWLAFNRVKGIGPARFALLLGAFVTARAAWEASPADWRAVGIDERTAASVARQRARIVPEAEVERLEHVRVAVLTLKHSSYPSLLREIAQPPPV
ncbi:MAG TPA: hypothetical protein VF916_10535, partial [Ktedonobacterales bacterium]